MAALMALLACSNGRGGGDLAEHPLIGRWAGDRIAVVGDYAERGDLAPEHNADLIYDLCRMGEDPEQAKQLVKGCLKSAAEARERGDEQRAIEYEVRARCLQKLPPFRDISDDILPVVEATCGVKITGEGWRKK